MIRACILAAALAIATAAFSWPVSAREPCGRRAQIVDHLARQYSEILIAVAGVNARQIIEVLASPDGRSWTLIVTNSDGVSCVVAAGDDWQYVPPVRRGEGT